MFEKHLSSPYQRFITSVTTCNRETFGAYAWHLIKRVLVIIQDEVFYM